MKYELIKTYPGSPKLNTIIDDETTTFGVSFSKTNLSSIENYPEFWEEVIEKDYEILSMKCNKSSLLHFNNVESSINFMLKNDYSVHSVKRKSDGEIFSIGDKIFPNNKIYKFELKNNILKIWHCDISFSTPIIEGPSGQPGNCSWIEGISNIKKVKQPLFTTEDGVDIFEGESYYELITPDFHNKPCIWNILPTKTRGDINYNQEGNRRNGRIWFSTKEKAEEYILMNKPCLSLNDIFKNVEEMRKGLKTFENSQLAKRFKKLVQQKLNN